MYSPINSGPAFRTRSSNRTYQPVRSRSISPRLVPLPSDSSSSSSDEASDHEVYLLPPPLPPPVTVIEDLSNMAEATLTPTPFSGENEDATVWWNSLEHYVTFKKITDDQFLGLFPLLLRGTATQWFQNLAQGDTDSKAHIKTAFEAAFKQREASKWKKERELYSRKQQDSETVLHYITEMQTAARGLEVPPAQLIRVITGGLHPHLRAYTLQQAPDSIKNLLDVATLAEATIQPEQTASLSILQELQSIKSNLAALQAPAVMPATPAPRPSGSMPPQPRTAVRGRGYKGTSRGGHPSRLLPAHGGVSA